VIRRALSWLAAVPLVLLIAGPAIAWSHFSLDTTCKPDQDHLGWYIDAPAGEPNYVFQWSYDGQAWTTFDLGIHVGDLVTPETSASSITVRYRDDHAVSETAPVRHVLCETPTPTPASTPSPSPQPTATPTSTPDPTPSPTIQPTPTPTPTSSASPTETASTTPSGTPSATLTPTAPVTLPPTATSTPPPAPPGRFDALIGLVALLVVGVIVAELLIRFVVQRRRVR
jgi:hypothetical protein